MNSSTFNFKTEAKVIALVLLALLACELALRKFETSLSLDLQHIRSLPTLAKNLSKGEGLRILFLGNSFTRVSVNPEVFVREMKRHGFGNITVGSAHPDGTRINEWYYAFKTYFAEPRLLPDLLVVITGRAHLVDLPIDPSTMGAYFFKNGDLRRFLADRTNSIDDKIEMLLAHYSAVYACRRRIEPRVFTVIIPHYQQCLQRINESHTPGRSTNRRIRPPSYNQLQALLDLARKESVPVVVATVPMMQPYSIDPKIKEIVADKQMELFEASELEMDASHFPDGYHIDDLGAEKYTQIIAAKFAELFTVDPRFQKAR